MKQRVIVSRVMVPEKPAERPPAGLTAAQATVAVAAFSALSAIATAWVTGAFKRQKAVEASSITAAAEQAIARIEAQAISQVEDIRREAAVALEQAKAAGSIEIERFKLQRDLVLRAMEAADSDAAKEQLAFFAETGLLPDFEEGVLAFVEDADTTVPVVEPAAPIVLPATLVSAGSLALDEFESIWASRVGVLVHESNEFVCNATFVAEAMVATPAHCAGGERDYFFTTPFGSGSVDPLGPFQRANYLGGAGERLAAVSLYSYRDDSGARPASTVPVRAPIPGEAVSLIGWVPDGFVFANDPAAPRGLLIRPTGQLGLHRECRVTEVDTSMGVVMTDCISARGMSGGAIFARSDGALITLIAFGDGYFGPTAGPLLTALPERIAEFAGR